MTDVDVWVWRCDKHGLNPTEFPTCGKELIDDAMSRGHAECTVQYFRLRHPEVAGREVTIAELMERLASRIKQESIAADVRGYHRGAAEALEAHGLKPHPAKGVAE